MTNPNLPYDFNERDQIFLDLAALKSQTGANRPEDLPLNDEVIDVLKRIGALLAQADDGSLSIRDGIEIKLEMTVVFIDAGFNEPEYVRGIIRDLITLQTASSMNHDYDLVENIKQRIAELRKLL